MDIVARVAHNLSAWMSAHPDLRSIKKVAARSGVGFGTVQRAKNGDGNITIRNLELIARAFRRPVEDLMGMEYTAGRVLPMVQAQEPRLAYAGRLKELMDIVAEMDDLSQAELLGRAKEMTFRCAKTPQNKAS